MTETLVAEQARSADSDARGAPALTIARGARALARKHRVTRDPPAPLALLAGVEAHAAWLDRATAAARHRNAGQAAAAEWLLDNHYLARRALVRVQEDMPRRFYRRLPALDGAHPGFAGLPRIYALAHGLLDSGAMQLSRALVEQFIVAYQTQQVLRIAELWALPTMLRIACLERLAIGIERAFADVPHCRHVQQAVRLIEAAAPEDSRGDSIGRALSSLRAIAAIPWKDVFDRVSVVEAILQRDPAGVYARTDFETRDRWRKTIEDFAARSGREERDVAEAVLAQCLTQPAPDAGEPGDGGPAPLERHVGFWLEGEGRDRLAGIMRVREGLAHRAERALRRLNGPLYAAALLLVSGAAAAIPLLYLAANGASPAMLLGGLVLVLLPATVLGVNIVNWLVAHLVHPHSLPRLDFARSIAADCPTAVVMPVIVAREADVSAAARQLESHRLANPDPMLRFVLLSDHPDAPEAVMPEDAAREALLVRAIEALNARYGTPEADGRGPAGPFLLLHRARRFNPAQGCWMGWERKRGKLEQLNALILKGDRSGFSLVAGDAEALRGVRFVVTVDSDTRLSPGTVARLVGTLAHPLNCPRFDATTGKVTRGYTVLQPRVDIAPGDSARSLFARLVAGDTSIDIYSRAVSDVYQDLFGTGIFAGKGIYEVAAFAQSLEGRVPENRILSHDLFEGLHGRAGLASDIVVHEQMPSTYLQHRARNHRWIRGDWQLLPWLGRRVPGPDGQRLANRFSLLGRWQILDNLRRSLVPASLVGVALCGWLVLPGHPLVWTLLGILVLGAHLFTDLVSAVSRRITPAAPRTLAARLREGAGRFALSAMFLLSDALNNLDAIGRTLWRLHTGRNLLEWTSAAEAEARASAENPKRTAARQLWPSSAIALAMAVAIAVARPHALPWAAPLLLLWGLAPALAVWTSRPADRPAPPLPEADTRYLRRVARRTWLFFETFVRPEDHWLPPDNYQEAPQSGVARRTSPTNIGMLFLSSLTAWRLGHVGLPELAERSRNTLDALDLLERHRGHILNWVETRNLASLEPRYVSTVDSGNLAVSLVALRQGFEQACSGPALQPWLWDGLADTLALLDEAMSSPAARDIFSGPCRSRIAEMLRAIDAAKDDPARWRACLESLWAGPFAGIGGCVQEAIASAGPAPAGALREVQAWLERCRHHLFAMRRDFDTLAPWHRLLEAPPAGAEALAAAIAGHLPLTLPIAEAATAAERARAALDAAALPQAAAVVSWCEELRLAIAAGVARLAELRALLATLGDRCHAMAMAMDFAMLYDPSTRLLHIGYDVSAGRLDPHHYDLLASEARLASFFAIAKGDVPAEHWAHLGRPITRHGGACALLSWSGSMFEYLMPTLLMESEPHTLLGQSCRAAIDWQRARGRRLGIPWGVSESGYAAQDAEKRYRYRAFGIPELGIRRGLEEDRVVAPYASMMAVPFRPAEAVRNLRALEALGMLGRYGFYEAADFTPGRVPMGARMVAVQSYMAHHHGMSLAALGNQLAGGFLVRLFLSDPQMRTLDALLHERLPAEAPVDPSRLAIPTTAPAGAAPAAPGLVPWKPAQATGFAELHALSNGRLTSLLTTAGSGSLSWQGHLLARAVGAGANGEGGTALLLHDRDAALTWPLGAPRPDVPGEADVRTTFHAHMLEQHHRAQGIAATILVGIAPGDDIEIRRITLVNETGSPRRLAIASCGEVVLAPAPEHHRHPAFSRLFVGSQWLEPLQGLVFTRRPRKPGERPPVLLHRHVADSPDIALVGFETDRRVLLGRRGWPDMPEALLDAGGSGRTGWTLDPVMAVQLGLTLEPYGRRELAFVTIAAGTLEEAQEIALRHATLASLDWALEAAPAAKAQEMQERGLRPHALPAVQRLLSQLLSAGMLSPWPTGREDQPGPHQPDLWASGISGDHPILAVRVSEGRSNEILDLVLRAHRLWHDSGIPIDLCLLHDGTPGYLEPVRERLQAQLQAAGSMELLGRRGGVHLVHEEPDASHPSAAIAALATVLLEADAAHPAAGDLAAQLDRMAWHQPASPRFVPERHGETGAFETEEEARGAGVPGGGRLLFDNGFGGFCPESGDYVIKTGGSMPPTPGPWCNVLANRGFGTIVTEAGLGFTWAGNAGENRLTPWHNDPVSDPQVEALYLRDELTAAVWTPTPLPAGQDRTATVRHRPGATLWRGSAEGLEQELLVFVAAEDPVKLVRLRLRNPGQHTRRVTATYFARWQLGAVPGAADPFLEARYDPHASAIIARNRRNPDFAGRPAFLSSTLQPHSITTARPAFLGPQDDMRRPAGLEQWDLGRAFATRGDCCGAYQVHLEVGPGAETEVVFLLGQGRTAQETAALCQRFREPGRVDAELRGVERLWEERLGAVQVETPDPAFDLMINRWLLTQAISSRLSARAGFYQASGAVGFRDQLQDVMALLLSDPGWARSHILEAAAHQFEEGDVLHWWHPPGGQGVRTRFSDDLLWLPYCAAHYVEATGDAGILAEPVPFLRAPPLGRDEEDRYARFEPAPEAATLFEHLERALARGYRLGSDGLPLMGAGDWNDGMDRVGWRGRGQSVWLAWFLIATIDGFIRLCPLAGREELVAEWRARREALVGAIEAHGWDGAWYLRAIDDDGRPWGSSANEECRIDLLSQAWAVLTGAGDPARAREALESAARLLMRPDDDIVRLLTPAFNATARDPGYIKAYPPGIRENGGQYSHAAAWLGMAFARLGDGARAKAVFDRINPAVRAQTPEGARRMLTEPYVVSADIGGEPPHVGRGGWSWYTGAAAWTWRLGVESILGISLVGGALRIAPCLPPGWRRCTARIRQPGGSIRILFERADRPDAPALAIHVDGEPSAGLVRFPTDGSERSVRVVLGDVPQSGAPHGMPPPETQTVPA